MSNKEALYPRRKNLRLPHNDYHGIGHYFVTVCTLRRREWFGDAGNQQMIPNSLGKTVEEELRKGVTLHEGVILDEFIVMPNHVHVILGLLTENNLGLGRMMGMFKAAVTRRARQGGHEDFAWQRNYYEHAIRGEGDLGRIREYIIQNPLRWEEDEENPATRGRHSCRPYEERATQRMM